MAAKKRFVLLMVDDDEDDWILVKDAFDQEEFACKFELDLNRLENGQELLDYLDHCKEGEEQKGPTPDLILLDLNMPVKGGMETLKEIKSHPICRGIPIVVFTTSGEETDVVECYECGGASFIQKPGTFESLKNVVRTLADYWFCTTAKRASA